MAEDPNRPPLSDEPDREESPGVVPGGARPRPSGDDPQEGFFPVSEIIVEVAPTNPLFGEQEPRTEQIVEVAPDDPAERRPGPSPYEPASPIEEIAPEVQPEIAPEVQPSETEPSRPTDPSEVIIEVAPEVAPER
jgi:hypothetical protein